MVICLKYILTVVVSIMIIIEHLAFNPRLTKPVHKYNKSSLMMLLAAATGNGKNGLWNDLRTVILNS